MSRTPDPDRLLEWLNAGRHDPADVIARSNQGLLLRYPAPGGDLIVKTPSGNPATRRLQAWMLGREFRAYRRLAGLPGIVRCHGLLDGRHLVLDRVDGVLAAHAGLPDRQTFLVRLLSVIRAIHDRGVAHGDLKRKVNIMIDRSGQPVILDFGTSVLRRPGRHPLNRRLFEFMRQTDLNAWIKFKYPGYSDIRPADHALYRPSRVERLLRRLRR